MRRLLWKVFPPYEVKLTLEEVRAFLAQAESCREVVEPRVISLVKDAEKTVYSVRIERMKPDQLALLLVTNVLGKEIGSGQHHTYRGVLSMVGKDMLKSWHAAQQTMLARGYCTEAEVDEDNRWIQEQIKGAG
jgi:hypothetical protein